MPANYCSFCYGTGHTPQNCTNCNYCTGSHAYEFKEKLKEDSAGLKEWDSKREKEEKNLKDYLERKDKQKKLGFANFIKLPEGQNSRRRRNRFEEWGLNSLPPPRIGYMCINKTDGYLEMSLDVEKGHGFLTPLALRVAIFAKLSGFGNNLIYMAYVDNSREVIDHCPAFSGVNVNEVINQGHTRVAVKNDVLKLMSMLINLVPNSS